MVSREEVITLIDDAFIKYNNKLNNYFKDTVIENKNEKTELLKILKDKLDIYDKIQNHEYIDFIQDKLCLSKFKKETLFSLSNEALKNLRNMLRMLDLENGDHSYYKIAIGYAYDAIKFGISDPEIIKAIKKILNL
jgi:hypothetical protein